ncbi:MAG TPA: hypothetical protein VMZ73_09035 [Acidimicrobiales bacterium]|nr:hypothetical protein [Acidimicrobiales bacterium]
MTNEIAALLREREHYTRRGLPDRVAEVDAELARRGHRQQEVAATPSPPPAQTRPETASIEAPETTRRPRPQPRRSEPNAE